MLPGFFSETEMTQAIDIIKSALGHLRVVDASGTPSPEETEDALKSLNSMVMAWEAENMPIGWCPLQHPEDEINSPIELDECLGYNLALRLRARYGVTADPDVINFANAGLGLLRSMIASSSYDRVQYDDLPRGDQQPNIYGWRAGYYL
jgi:hypothetical protein